MKPYQEESLDRDADPNGLLRQPTFGKAVGSSLPRPESEPRAGATGSAEISIAQRKTDMARLAEPAEEEEISEVDRRVSCVANTIRRQVEGLTRMDAERFFAALRDRIDDIEREAFDEAASHAAPGHSRRSQHSAVPAPECGMSTTTPPFPTNRDRALRRIKDTIAALDLAGSAKVA